MVVSDSSTLIVLLDLDRMELLSDLFAEVTIPPSVHREITYRSADPLPDFISVATPRDVSHIDLLRRLLDPGESEAIALAVEHNCPLIIDERKGHKIALEQGVTITGLLGIVYRNVRKGWLTIDEAEAFIADAREHGYRIGQKLVDGMLAALSKE